MKTLPAPLWLALVLLVLFALATLAWYLGQAGKAARAAVERARRAHLIRAQRQICRQQLAEIRSNREPPTSQPDPRTTLHGSGVCAAHISIEVPQGSRHAIYTDVHI